MKFYSHLYGCQSDSELRQYRYPITETINGEWTLVSQKGTEEYLKKRNGGKFNDLIFLHANQLFKCDENNMKQAQLIGSQKVFEQETTSNEESTKEDTVSTTYITRNELRTETKYKVDGSQEFDEIEERWLDGENGLTIQNRMYWKTIENKYDVVECTRVYERVEPGVYQKSIKDEIVGSWSQIAMDGLTEFCQNVNVKNAEAWNQEARLHFSHITIFNEIQMQHLDVNGESLKFEFAVISEEPKYTGTFFWDNSLVTINEEMRIVRHLKDDKLFVTCRKNEHYFVAVYEKC